MDNFHITSTSTSDFAMDAIKVPKHLYESQHVTNAARILPWLAAPNLSLQQTLAVLHKTYWQPQVVGSCSALETQQVLGMHAGVHTTHQNIHGKIKMLGEKKNERLFTHTVLEKLNPCFHADTKKICTMQTKPPFSHATLSAWTQFLFNKVSHCWAN